MRSREIKIKTALSAEPTNKDKRDAEAVKKAKAASDKDPVVIAKRAADKVITEAEEILASVKESACVKVDAAIKKAKETTEEVKDTVGGA